MAKINLLAYRPHNLFLTPIEEIMIKHHGVAFFGVRDMIEILMNSDGVYYLKFTDDVRTCLAAKCNIAEARVSEIVIDMVRRKIFNPTVFERYGVLTNFETQKWFLESTKRRKQVRMIKAFLSSSIIQEVGENVVFIDENVNKNEQRKEKESRNSNTNINREKEQSSNENIRTFSLEEKIKKFRTAFPGRFTDDVKFIKENVDIDLLIEKINESHWLKNVVNWSLKTCLKNYEKIVSDVYMDRKTAAQVAENRARILGHNYPKEKLECLFTDLEHVEI